MSKTEKEFFRTGEVADMFKVSSSTLRYWEREFNMIKPLKTQNGRRRFSRKDIDNFRLIHYLIKERGMTIEGVHQYIKNKKKTGDFEKLEVISTLKRTKEFLIEVKKMLDKNHHD